MTESYFLWPKSNVLRALVSAPRFVTAAMIEEKLRSMYPTGHPVLCSSGRAALVLALIESGVSRSDLVGVFPYASHCVLDAISRVATPHSGPTATAAALRVVYHQWGYVLETNLPANAIEDCVDTLCVPGTELFPGGGRFEIWSLPKILGTTSGGVLWCRDGEAAEKIRGLRDERGGGLFQWFLRLLATNYPRAYFWWQGAEGASGRVSRLQTGEIWMAVQQWSYFVNDRHRKLELIWPLAVKWLTKPTKRLPPVVPIRLEQPETAIRDWGLSAGFRIIERIHGDNHRDLVKVLPLPIHQDVSEIFLASILEKLNSQRQDWSAK